ncbi:polyphenol oxidase family protein [Nocardioides ferulae]|uniref:polyphenol oxidase family protein n=1 Tax=Nocardioides ferulae TaxID=2340821 RepID=UPI001F0BC753|nr:polyphenol oxidase family protein [Nocardioides ferulae]
MYHHRSSHPAGDGGVVEVAFTDRHGGVSEGPFASLNLAVDGADDPAARAENLRRVLADFAPGDDLVDLRQVHGATVHVDDGSRGQAGARPEADGVVTGRAGAVLAVRAADCVPVLLADLETGVVGAAHAGRQGVLTGVVPATVVRMRELGAGPVTAWIGPHVCGACYEVPEQLQREVLAAVPQSRATTSWGTPALDLGAGVRAQLAAAPGGPVTVVDVSACTLESDHLYSHRRDSGRAGRIAGLVRRSPPRAGREAS